MADPYRPKRNAEHLTAWDQMRSGFVPVAERADWLQNRADLNKAAKDAADEEERQRRAEGERARKNMNMP